MPEFTFISDQCGPSQTAAAAVAAAVAYGAIGFIAVVCPGTGGHYGVDLTVK